MKPVRGSNYIDVPLTLDVANTASYITKSKLLFGYLIVCGIVIAAITVSIIFHTVQICVVSAVVAIVALMLMRVCWFEERRYRKCYRNITEHNNAYGSDTFWGIYEISEGAMPICYYKNGQKALFVAFEKDIKIGAGEDAREDHWDALTAAYRQLVYKHIQFMHIDYMDSIGKNKRLDTTVDKLMQTPNPDLRKLLGITFDYQKQLLKDAYLTYDVYVFFYKGDDNTFRTDIETVLNQMLQANYSHYYYMRTDELRELVKSLYGMSEFSALQASETVFGETVAKKRIRVISYTKDGETTKVHMTREEEQQAAQAQQEARHKNRRKRGVPTASVKAKTPIQHTQDKQQDAPVQPVVNDTVDIGATFDSVDTVEVDTDELIKW